MSSFHFIFILASHATLPQPSAPSLSLCHTHTYTQAHDAKIDLTATTESHTQLGSAWRYARLTLPMKPDDSDIKEQETSSRTVGRSQKKGGGKQGKSSDVPLAQCAMWLYEPLCYSCWLISEALQLWHRNPSNKTPHHWCVMVQLRQGPQAHKDTRGKKVTSARMFRFSFCGITTWNDFREYFIPLWDDRWFPAITISQWLRSNSYIFGFVG